MLDFISEYKGFIVSYFVELLIGYALFTILAYLILIPGKDKILNVYDEKEYAEAKTESKRVRKWFFLVWAIIMLALNIIIILY